MEMLHVINACNNDDTVTLHYIRLIESRPSNHRLFKCAENHSNDSDYNNNFNNSPKFCIICCRLHSNSILVRDRISLIIPYLLVRQGGKKLISRNSPGS